MISNPHITMITSLQNSHILNFGPIGDWFPFEENMTGCIGWYNRYDVERDVIIYATPHWESEGVVPVEAITSDGGCESLHTFELSLRESVEYQLNQYISILATIIHNYESSVR
jgi:hypothetical protein